MKEVRKTFEISTVPSETKSFSIFGPGIVGTVGFVAKNTSNTILLNFLYYLKGELTPPTGAPTPLINVNSLTGEFHTDDSGNVVIGITNSSLEDVVWTIEYNVIRFN